MVYKKITTLMVFGNLRTRFSTWDDTYFHLQTVWGWMKIEQAWRGINFWFSYHMVYFHLCFNQYYFLTLYSKYSNIIFYNNNHQLVIRTNYASHPYNSSSNTSGLDPILWFSMTRKEQSRCTYMLENRLSSWWQTENVHDMLIIEVFQTAFHTLSLNA